MTETVTPLHRPIGYVEPHEEAIAIAAISADFAAVTGSPDLPRAAGYMLFIKLHVRDEELKTITRADGSTTKLYLPQKSLDEDKYQSVTGLVVSVGPQAYTGSNSDGSPKFPGGAWCRVGDFVVLPRYESFLMMWKGKIALAAIPDDKIIGIVRDPNDLTAPHMASLI